MIDESPIKVQDKDKPGACHQGYVWANVMKLIQLLYAIEALARESEMSHEQRHALRLDKSL